MICFLDRFFPFDFNDIVLSLRKTDCEKGGGLVFWTIGNVCQVDN